MTNFVAHNHKPGDSIILCSGNDNQVCLLAIVITGWVTSGNGGNPGGIPPLIGRSLF